MTAGVIFEGKILSQVKVIPHFLNGIKIACDVQGDLFLTFRENSHLLEEHLLEGHPILGSI